MLNYAVALRLRPDNPAAEAVAALPPLPRPRVSPFLPPKELAELLAAVRRSRARDSTRLAFEFFLLTARRSGEVCAAHWDDIDLHDALWTVPVEPMKRRWRAVYRVPLSSHALAVLYQARELNGARGLLFSNGSHRPVSTSSLSALLRRLEITVTTLSFRRSFRQWCAESGVAEYVAEACLGYLVGYDVDSFNVKPDCLRHRRPVMEDWGAYVAGNPRHQ